MVQGRSTKNGSNIGADGLLRILDPRAQGSTPEAE